MVLKISALLVAVSAISLLIRVKQPEIAMALGIAAGAFACYMALDEIRDVISVIRTAAERADIGGQNIYTLLRACGIALIGEYAAQLCRDAGEGALAQRVDFASRISLLALSAPLAAEVMEMIMELPV